MILILLAPFTFIGLLFFFFWLKKIAIKNKIIKQKQKIKEYFKNYDANTPLAIVDATPRLVEIGKRQYILSPLKYRQVTKICVLFAKTLQKIQGLNINLDDTDKMIGTVIEHCEEDFFKALAYVLYYSKNPKEDDELIVVAGVAETFDYLKDNITLQDMTNILEIIIMQNDIKSAIKSFGRIGDSKKKL